MTTDDPALDGQPSPLVVGEAQPPFAKLLTQDSVLLAQEVDDLQLAGVDQPAIQTTRNRTASVPIAPPW